MRVMVDIPEGEVGGGSDLDSVLRAHGINPTKPYSQIAALDGTGKPLAGVFVYVQEQD